MEGEGGVWGGREGCGVSDRGDETTLVGTDAGPIEKEKKR